MKKLVLNMLCMGALFFFASCSKQSETPEVPEIPEIPETPEVPEKPDISEIKEVRVSVSDFAYEQEEASRTSYSINTTCYEVKWAEGDILGICPEGGTQVAFPVTSGTGEKTAIFNGDKWPLKATVGFAAYYPFDKENYLVSASKIPVFYADQEQYGNETATHLSSFDYLASKLTKLDSEGRIILDMKHVGCIFLLKLTMPQVGTYTTVTLTSDNKEFIIQGTLNLTKEVPSITSTSTSKTLTVNLKDVTLESDEELLVVNLMVAPTDLSDSAITITVTDSNGDTYAADSISHIAGQKFIPEKAYVFTRTMVAPAPDPDEEKEGSTGAELEPGGGIEEG